MTPSNYATSGSVESLRRRLLPTDWLVVRDVATMRLAQATDLQALAALRGEVHVRQFRRRLQRLYELQVLDRLDRRVGGERAGSSAWVYVLGLAGQRLLDEGGSSSVRRPWTPRPSWLHHALASSHLYVELRTAENSGVLTLLDYESEPKCWRTFTSAEGKETLKPDSFIRFETGEEIVSTFIEVDCGTESPATIARKLSVYVSAFEAGFEQNEHGVFPETVWLVPSSGRQRVLEKVVARLPVEARALFRVALYEHALQAFLEPP
jgi:hypothetical protein